MDEKADRAVASHPDRNPIKETNRACGRKRPALVIWDRTDRRGDCLKINKLHDPAGGVLVAHAPPRGMGNFATSMLESLGKDLAPHRGRSQWDHDAALRWLRGERITDVVVYGAHRIEDDLWRYIEYGPRFIFVTPSETAAKEIHEHNSPSFMSSLGKLFSEISPANRRGSNPEAKPEPFPDIPYNDFTTFLAAAYELADGPGIFRSIESTFRSGFDFAQASVGPDVDKGIDPQVLSQTVGRQLLLKSSDAEAICWLRGVQAGLFRVGIVLRTNLRDLLGVLHLDRRRATTQDLGEAVRRSVDHMNPAIAVIAFITDLTDIQISELKRSSLSDDVGTISASDHEWQVPLDLRAPLRILRAQWGHSKLSKEHLLFRDRKDLLSGTGIKRSLWEFRSQAGLEVRPTTAAPKRGGGAPLLFRHIEIESLP